MLREMKSIIGRLLPGSAEQCGRAPRARMRPRHLSCEPLEHRQMLSVTAVDSALDYAVVDTVTAGTFTAGQQVTDNDGATSTDTAAVTASELSTASSWTHAEVDDEASAFFDDSYVHDLYITFDDANWYNTLYNSHASDADDPYFEADFECDGVVMESVGVRFKGSSSFDIPGVKKSLKIDFDEYDEDNDELAFLGLKKLNLNNNYNDPTMMREKLFLDYASNFVEGVGRAVHTNVYINGEYWGLYTAVEQIDKTFVQSRFGSGEDGNLYKGAASDEAGDDPQADFGSDLTWLGDDLDLYDDFYQLKTNETAYDYSELVEFIDVLNNTPTEDLAASIEPLLDVDDAIAGLAINNLFANLDSYSGAAHNYYLYDRDDTGQFTHILWDANESFGTFAMFTAPGQDMAELDPFWVPLAMGRPGQVEVEDRPLMENLWAVDEYSEDYLRDLAEMLRGGFDVATASERIDELADLIRDDVYADPNKQYTSAQFETNLDDDIVDGGRTIYGLTSFIGDRADYLSAELDTYATQSDLRLNELMSANVATAQDESGDYDPWVEIYNFGSGLVDLSGLYLTDDAGNLTKWALPSGNLDDGEFLTLWIDGEVGEGSNHASFSLSVAGGELHLSDGVTLIDTVTYDAMADDLTLARVPDGDGNWESTDRPTPGAENLSSVVSVEPVVLHINEFMADNDTFIEDPDEAGAYEDWVELYNPGTESVDLSGMYMTDDLTDPVQWQFPAGMTIDAGGYLVVWADKDTDQGDAHAAFKLSTDGETIALYNTDGATLIDSIEFGVQTTDVSYGRYPDGTESWVSMATPTPGAANVDEAAGNVTPMADAGGPYTGQVGNTVSLTAAASSDSDGTIASYAWDLDDDGQYDDATGVTATFDAATAGTFTVGLQVTDDEGATNADTATVTVTVDPVTPVVLYINELMADNDTVIEDPDEAGAYEDWVELYNPGTESVDLSGMYMTDDLTDPIQWQFPAGMTIDAGGYLVVWADKDTDQGDAHAAFKLSTDGETIALYNTDGTTLIDSIEFGVQTTDVSYGRYLDGTENWVSMTTPTPGAANVDEAAGNVAPTADAGGPYTGQVGNTVALTAAGSSDTDGMIAAYAWDLDNDGQYDDATGVTASFDTATAGTFTVGLQVTDDEGATNADTATVTVTVDPVTPVVLYINELMADNDTVIEDPDEAGAYEDWVELYNPGSESVDLSGMYMTDDVTDPVQWQFPAGMTIDAGGYLVVWADKDTDQGDAHAAFKLSTDGETIALYNTDGATLIDSIEFGVQTTDVSYGRYPDGTEDWVSMATPTPGAANVDETVSNVAPTAEAGGPYSGTEGDAITLDASGSADSDGTITAYAWDLDNDGQYDDATGVTAGFDAATAGTFTVGLQVTDDEGATNVDSATVTVSEPASIAPMASDGGPYNGETGETLTLDASGSVDPDGTIVSYAWDLDNDGQYDDATGVTATYDATVAGTFAISVMVTDDASATSTDTAIVTISNSVVEPGSYVIVDTGQEDTYDDNGNVITEPEPGEAFYGQDGQYDGVAFAFEDNGDGTVADQNTGLTWQQTPSDVSMSYEEALEYANSAELGGYDDWRLPTAKELFSLSNFSEGWPYLDTEYFDLVGASDGAPPEGTEPPEDAPPAEEDGDGTVSKDEQYWASYYVGTTHGDQESAFGVNAATGHIKAYPAEVSGQFGNYVRLVRGDIYGENSFVDNGDGTVTDLATGLMWQQADSGVGMDWEDALDYAEDLELAGYDDWVLPDIKQLQSILDYTQSPTAINEADIGPAIDTDYFDITQLPDGTTNTDSDYPYFWSSTSAYFGGDSPEYYYAWYASFGTAVDDNGDDSHGAGGVRFDTKVEGGPDGEGGERIYNFVRAVRYVGTETATNEAPTAEAGELYSGQVGGTITLDGSGSTDTDGTIALYEWDLDNDGQYDDATGATASFAATTAGTFTVGLQVTDDDGATDTDTATVTVTPGGPPLLGPVEDMTLSGLDLSNGDLEYLVEPARDGYLTLLSAAGDLQWQLFDPDTMSEIVPAHTGIEGRDDYVVAGTEAYLLRLAGQATGFDLRLVNLVDESDDTVNVYGTDGEDTFVIQCTTCEITINGVDYDFDESVVNSVQFDGAGGSDQADITGTIHAERIDLSPGSGSLFGETIDVAVVNTESIRVDGGGGVDEAYLVDSDGDDTVVADGQGMTMSGETLAGEAFTNSVSNVTFAHAYATSGGFDRAELTGTAGKYDCFKGYVDPSDPNGQFGKLWTNGTQLRAKFFDDIVARGNEGDWDKAVFVSTTGSDRFEAGPDAATLTNSYVQYATTDFGDVRAYAASGGDDTLVLTESEGTDKMWLLSHKAVASGADYRVRARSFDHVVADAAVFDGDRDEVRLYDSSANDTLTVTLDEAQMTGGVDFTAKGFRKVKAYSLYAGDTDVATITGGTGDDSLTARSDSDGVLGMGDCVDLLASTPEGIALLRAVAFSDVTVDGGDGNNTASTPDDVAALDYVLRMEGQWDE